MTVVVVFMLSKTIQIRRGTTGMFRQHYKRSDLRYYPVHRHIRICYMCCISGKLLTLLMMYYDHYVNVDVVAPDFLKESVIF